MYEYKESGLPGVFLANGYEIRETQYGESISIEDIKGLHKAIGCIVVNKSGVLSRFELRYIRKELGFSQKALADTLGVTEITVRKWEDETESKISKPCDRLLKTIYLNHIDPESPVSDFVNRIASLDNRIQEVMMNFELHGEHWDRTFAA